MPDWQRRGLVKPRQVLTHGSGVTGEKVTHTGGGSVRAVFLIAVVSGEVIKAQVSLTYGSVMM